MQHYTYMLAAREPYMGMRFYVGVRSFNGLASEDAYLGTSTVLKPLLKSKEVTVTKEILAVWPSRKVALEHEIFLHECFDIARNPLFFNKARQLVCGFDTTGTVSHFKGKKHSAASNEKNRLAALGRPSPRKGCKHLEESNQKNRLAHLGKKPPPLSDEAKKRISLANTGRVKSKETLEKMSVSSKGQIAWNKGLKGGTSWNVGITWTPEHREAIRIAKLTREQNGTN